MAGSHKKPTKWQRSDFRPSNPPGVVMKDQMGDTGTKISGFMATLDSSTSPIDFSIAKQSGDKVSLTNRGEPLALISDCHSFDSCSILA
jgi:hypothetical protein